MEPISYQIKVEEAKYLSDFLLEVHFNDGVKKIVDLRNELTGVFERLKDQAKFKNFRIEKGILCWEDDLDLAPEFLRYVCKDFSGELLSTKK